MCVCVCVCVCVHVIGVCACTVLWYADWYCGSDRGNKLHSSLDSLRHKFSNYWESVCPCMNVAYKSLGYNTIVDSTN